MPLTFNLNYISINAIRSETLNLRFPFSEFLLCGRESGEKFIHFKDISNIFLLLSKLEFSPWDVYLQNRKTGIMLHFLVGASLETLATKKFTIFCPFLFGAPYKISFSVYALGKKVDGGFLPDSWFESETTAKHAMLRLRDCGTVSQMTLEMLRQWTFLSP